MALELALWKVNSDSLEEIESATLNLERRLEEWLAKDSSILGMELFYIGRQVRTEFGGYIDLLALDSEGNCIVIELKKGRTPREVIAQLLDYGAWVNKLGFDELDGIAQTYTGKNLSKCFSAAFDNPLPDKINVNHSLVLVAAELDDSSERIIDYLNEVHGVAINAVFFRFYKNEGSEFLGRAWLKDPEMAAERSGDRKKTPWTGIWYYNVGEGPHRNWEDYTKYNIISAGGHEKYSRPLRRLNKGDRFFAYLKGRGYVGYGEVITPAVPIAEYEIENGQKLLDQPMKAVNAGEHRNSIEKTEYVARVKWLKEFSRDEALNFNGAFANPNVVCKLRDSITLDHLRKSFDLLETSE